MWIAALLALGIGGVLGLLGGGGSILFVPALVYGLDMAPKEAIATSLVVVGATALVAALRHGQMGRVRWRLGLGFGAAGMVGAWLGGAAAAWFSGTTLLIFFAMMMGVTGVAMLAPKSDKPSHTPSKGLIAAEGVGVGAVTGLVGAGGGFLVVPVLALVGGLTMHEAVGTSLLVIALKSGAGFLGHATHVQIDWSLAGILTLFSVLGSFGGAWASSRIDGPALRKGFAWFVLAMAVLVLGKEWTPQMTEALFVDDWPFWMGGIALGASVLAFARFENHLFGVSSGYVDVVELGREPKRRASWRLPFLAGIVGGGLLAAAASGTFNPSWTLGSFDTWVSADLAVKVPLFVGGGVMLGFGARLAGGCTSGHSIVGMSLRAPSSVMATVAFMGSGFVVTNLFLRSLGV